MQSDYSYYTGNIPDSLTVTEQDRNGIFTINPDRIERVQVEYPERLGYLRLPLAQLMKLKEATRRAQELLRVKEYQLNDLICRQVMRDQRATRSRLEADGYIPLHKTEITTGTGHETHVVRPAIVAASSGTDASVPSIVAPVRHYVPAGCTYVIRRDTQSGDPD